MPMRLMYNQLLNHNHTNKHGRHTTTSTDPLLKPTEDLRMGRVKQGCQRVMVRKVQAVTHKQMLHTLPAPMRIVSGLPRL